MPIETLQASLYDFPKYYDLLFGADWKAEYGFLRQCFARYAGRPVRRLYEPACGTGRLLVKLAQAGYEVAGNDLNPKAVEYCNARLARHGLPRSVTVADMADFRLPRPVDAAFNMINSFRHLPTEEAAEGHLRCMAAALAPGGLYMLGLHLTPTRGRPLEEESWSARRGSLSVVSQLRTVRYDRPGRQEYVEMVLDVHSPRRQFRLVDEMAFRSYTAPQFTSLLARAPQFEVMATYDFGYEIDHPIKVDGRTQDVVFVLRRGK